jgi:hypothetical protein
MISKLIVSELKTIRTIVDATNKMQNGYRSMTVGQTSSLSSFAQAILLFRNQRLVHRREATFTLIERY